MTRVYYQDAVGCFIVCDVTRESTLEGAKLWKADFDRKVTVFGGSPVPCVLLANKVGQSYLTYMFHVNLTEHGDNHTPPPVCIVTIHRRLILHMVIITSNHMDSNHY